MRRIKSKERRPKIDKALQFTEERIQLRDTIREMIGDELDRRRMHTEGNPHPENPPPLGRRQQAAPPHPLAAHREPFHRMPRMPVEEQSKKQNH